MLQGVVSCVYSVWQQPSNQTVAAYAPSMGGGATAYSAGKTDTPGIVTLPSTLTAGRKLLGGRSLKQVPYNTGAWGRVSYGIRMATVDVRDLLASV